MGKANFTFVSSALRTLALVLAFGAFGWQSAFAQCDAPSNVQVTQQCDGSVLLTWDDATGANSYDVLILEDGLDDAGPSGSVSGTSFTAGASFFSSAAFGYNASITSNCGGGITATSDVFFEYEDFDAIPSVSVSVESNPECVDGTGEIEVSLTGGCDGATYTIRIDPDPSLGLADFDGATGAVNGDDVTISGLPVGDHGVYLELESENNCNINPDCFPTDNVDFTISATGVNEGPGLAVAPESGLFSNETIVEGDDPVTDVTVNLGTLNTGSDCCATVDFVYGAEDNCDDDVTITITTGVGDNVEYNHFPDNDADALGLISIGADGSFSAIFCAGTSSITITATDSDGNSSSVTYTATVADPGVTANVGCVPLNVTLDDNCSFNLSVQNVGAAQGIDCFSGSLSVIVDDGTPNGGTIDRAGTFRYAIITSGGEAKCWGEVTAEDKTGPVYQDNLIDYKALCFNVEDILNNPATVSTSSSNACRFLGRPEFIDACDGTIPFSWIKWYDAIEYEDCARPGELYATITRTWIAEDAEGNESDVETQTIKLYRPDTDKIRFWNGSDFGWETTPRDVTVNVCGPNGEEDFDLRTPYVLDSLNSECSSTDIYIPLSEVCGYGVSDTGVRFDAGCDGAYKWERTIKIFDWCVDVPEDGPSNVIPPEFNYVIKVGDFDAPEFDGPAIETTNLVDTPEELMTEINEAELDMDDFMGAPVINTGPFDCTANIFTSISSLNNLFTDGDDKPTIGDNCPGNLTATVTFYSYVQKEIYGIPTGGWEWVRGDYPMINGMATGIPCGLHVMVIQATDNCYNTNTAMIPFWVKDKVAPNMICDDKLKITLTNGDPKSVEAGYDQLSAYARVDAADVDEGSTDNCSDIDLYVRRSIPADVYEANLDFLLERYDIHTSYSDGSFWYVGPDGKLDDADVAIWKDGIGWRPGYGWSYNAEQDNYYTSYEAYVEFFCFDAGLERIIELRGDDQPKEMWGPDFDVSLDDDDGLNMGMMEAKSYGPGYRNSNTCWQDILIEDGTNVWINLEDDEYIPCTDPRLEIIDDALEAEAFPLTFSSADGPDATSAAIIGAFGAPEIIGTLCRDYSWTITIDDERDHCGFNYLDIEFTLTTEGKNPRTLYAEKRVSIYAVHDYWIKFPADAYADCTDPDVAGVETSAPEDNACDLLAISHEDEQFLATSDTSCYKIFRTWKVINWCEYDGETLPVIVGRDWDDYNGNDYDLGSDVRPSSARYQYNVVTRGDQTVDGDDIPGNSDLYVIVDRSDDAYSPDFVYYDNTADPFDGSTADNSSSNNFFIPEGYWWKVAAGRGYFGTTYTWWGGAIEPATGEAYFNDDMLLGVDRFGNRVMVSDESAWGDVQIGGSSDDNDVQGTPSEDDEDARYGSFGFWQYTQHVVVYDESTPVAEIDAPDAGSISNFDCAAETTFTVTVSDPCSVEDVAVVVEVNGVEETPTSIETVNGEVVVTVSARRVIGTYKIDVEVTDGCGNFTTETAEFEVFDDKAPAPICHEGIVVELMPTEDGGGAMAVWASDFIASPIGDCTGQGEELVNVGNGFTQPLVVEEAYSIYFQDSVDVDSIDSFYTSPFDDDAVTGITLTCDHLAGLDENSVMVLVFAEDGAGNKDYCRTFVVVQDNMNACNAAPGTGEVAGAVQTETAANVEGVEVQLSGERSMMYMTNANGAFIFSGLAEGHDYTVTPQLDQNHLNGVSTFDLVLISKHILGQSLDSPYKMIAADVNNSGSISTLDLIQLRKLILNIDTEFANNTSWRFVDADYSFNNPNNPFGEQWPEVKNFNNLSGNASASFVGVKVGDVNNSATVEARSATGTMAVNVAETELVAGNEYTIPFTADMAEIAGYQFTLNVDKAKAEIVDIVYGAATAENFGVFTDEGVITTSFNGEAAGELFGLVIRATADANLSEVLSIGSRYTAAEAYSTSDEQLDVALNFSGTTATAAEFALFQNTPNPFQGETLIGFNLPEAGEATLTIQDVAGRTVKMIEGDFVKGYNQVSLKSNELPSVGVFFYTLTAGDFSATKKMMIIDEVNR